MSQEEGQAHPDQLPRLPEGTRIGEFVLRDVIGQGGFAVVYRAQQERLDRTVALKVLDATQNKHSISGKRFLREINLVKTLEHPNIIRLYDFGERQEDGLLWMATELVRGRTLTQELHENGPLSTARARKVMLQVLSAMVEAHEQGIIHRDIKPSNIMLARKGADQDFVKVLDFGIGKALADSAADVHDDLSLEHGAGTGTPRYMAPEQFAQGNVGPHTDVYSLGLIFYEILTAKRAVPGSTVYEIVKRICTSQVSVPTELQGSVFEEIILTATQPKYQDRYGSALAFHEAIETLIDERGADTRVGRDSGGLRRDSGGLVRESGELPGEHTNLLQVHELAAATAHDRLSDTQDLDLDEIEEVDDDFVIAEPTPPPMFNGEPISTAENDRLFNTQESNFIERELEEGAGEAPTREPIYKKAWVWAAAALFVLLSMFAIIFVITDGVSLFGDEDPVAVAGEPVATGGMDDGADDESTSDDGNVGSDDLDDPDFEFAVIDPEEAGEADDDEIAEGNEPDIDGLDGSTPEADEVTVTINSRPRRAKIYRDGEEVCERTPCELSLPKAAAITLEARAPGYDAKTVDLKPEDDEKVAIRLKRNEPAPGSQTKKKDDPFAKVKAH